MSTTTRWVIDPANSSAEFRVPHFWGLVKVKGQSTASTAGSKWTTTAPVAWNCSSTPPA